MRRTDSEKGGVMAVMEGFWEEAALELRPLGLNRVNRGRARGSGKSWDQHLGLRNRGQCVSIDSKGWYFGWGQTLFQDTPRTPPGPGMRGDQSPL